MQPPDMLVTRFEIQELRPPSSVFSPYLPGAESFHLVPGLVGGNQRPLDTHQMVRERQLCQPAHA